MRARRQRDCVRLAAAATAALLLLAGCSGVSGDSSPVTSRPSSSIDVPPGSDLPTVAAIGDSIAIGLGVPADDAWPLVAASHLGWNLTDLGESGAGFTVPGVNTHLFDDQVSAAIRLRPQVVIVAATRNDLVTAVSDPAALRRATSTVIDRLAGALPDTTIIGMGAVWGTATAPPAATVIDDALTRAVADVGGHWLDIGPTFRGRGDLLLGDGVHPNSAGQSLLGRKVADAVSAAGIQPGPRSQ